MQQAVYLERLNEFEQPIAAIERWYDLLQAQPSKISVEGEKILLEIDRSLKKLIKIFEQLKGFDLKSGDYEQAQAAYIELFEISGQLHAISGYANLIQHRCDMEDEQVLICIVGIHNAAQYLLSLRNDLFYSLHKLLTTS